MLHCVGLIGLIGGAPCAQEFCDVAFEHAGMELRWEGEGMDMKGIQKDNGKVRVKVDARYFRPTEVDLLLGDPSKAVKTLGWNPVKTSFKELVHEMVDADIADTANVPRAPVSS